MRITKSVTGKLVLVTSIGILIIMIIAALIVTRSVSEMTSQQINKDIQNVLKLHAQEIENYFENHASKISSFYRNTTLLKWASNRTIRGKDLNTPEFEEIKSIFQREIDSDPTIVSTFLGLEATGEYVYELGVTRIDTYDVRTRPWWQEIRDSKEWVVGAVTYEPENDSFYIAINGPYYDFKNKFLGVGGTDVYLDAVTKIASEVHYQNAGNAFLITQDGDLVSFPGEKTTIVDVEKRETTNIKLEDFDEKQDYQGFRNIQQLMQSQEQGTSTVIWRDIPYYVQFQKVQVEQLGLEWSLAIMLPETIITEPVNNTIVSSILFIIVIVFVTIIILLITTRILLKPLVDVKDALIGISTGAGDLSQRLVVSNQDDIGELAEAFNNFISRVQHIVQRVKEASVDLQNQTIEMSQMSDLTLKRTSSSLTEMKSASDTVIELTDTADTVNSKVLQAQQDAQHASETAVKGQSILESSIAGLNRLNSNFDDAVLAISELRTSSESIGAVISVIKTIAEQTNLLALNAAIESARAGEQGRGFSVVADEVRQLAHRTEESTNSVKKIVEDLQQKTLAAEESMQNTKNEVNHHVDDNQIIHEQLTQITNVVTSNQNQMSSIVETTSKQTLLAQNINELVLSVNESNNSANDDAKRLSAICDTLKNNSDHLLELVSQFKV